MSQSNNKELGKQRRGANLELKGDDINNKDSLKQADAPNIPAAQQSHMLQDWLQTDHRHERIMLGLPSSTAQEEERPSIQQDQDIILIESGNENDNKK